LKKILSNQLCLVFVVIRNYTNNFVKKYKKNNMKMRKTISISLFLGSITLLTSCGDSEYDAMLKVLQDCVEEKFDNELSKFKTIDEALTAYDFESARTLLACYEDACYANDRRQNSCPKHNPYGDTKKEWADKKGQQNEHFKMMYKIINAEVTYFLNNGEYSKARASANESDLFFLYEDQLPSAVNKWVEEGKLDLALKVLSTYTFTTVFKKEDENTEFKSEVSAYNDMLYSVLNTALFESNISAIKKVLLLVKSTAIGDKNGPKYSGGSLQHSVLVDTPKNDMIKKIKEAGIVL